MDEYKKQFLESFDKIMESSEDIKLPDDVMKLCWRIWQASRAAIEIELPRECNPADCFTDVMIPHEVTEAIRAAGIKVKE